MKRRLQSSFFVEKSLTFLDSEINKISTAAACNVIMYVIPLIKPPRYNTDTKNPTPFLYSESNISYERLILQEKIKTKA